jgi:hypothetical protein
MLTHPLGAVTETREFETGMVNVCCRDSRGMKLAANSMVEQRVGCSVLGQRISSTPIVQERCGIVEYFVVGAVHVRTPPRGPWRWIDVLDWKAFETLLPETVS